MAGRMSGRALTLVFQRTEHAEKIILITAVPTLIE
jgi:hypothetical protein